MNLEGRIDITLAPGAVAIRSTRPQLAQKLLGGRTPAEAAKLAGLIFSLCGKAQRVACEAACAAAAGEGAAPGSDASRARSLAVALEGAQEHAWRLLLDWPRQAGQPADQDSQLRLRQAAADPAAFAATLDALLRDTLLGEPAAAWLARDLDAFDAWRRAGATPVARLFASLGEGADTGVSQAALLPALPALDDATACDFARLALDTPAFCGQPLWQGLPAETGAIARVHAQPLLAAWIARRGRGAGARLLARLLELAALPARLCGAGIPAGSFGSNGCAGKTLGATLVRAWTLGDNTGLAGVETSRGLLLHVVKLADAKVAQYRIVAPTEWNFHPAGPLFQALSGLDRGEGLEVRARLVAQSLDPCVAYGIEIENA